MVQLKSGDERTTIKYLATGIEASRAYRQVIAVMNFPGRPGPRIGLADPVLTERFCGVTF